MFARNRVTRFFSYIYLTTTTLLVVVGLLLALTAFLPALATDFSSSAFTVRDPVITVEGGRYTTSNFIYFSSTGQTDTGKNTTSNFTHCAGFLYFPGASIPVASATAGNGQVSLSWSSSSGSDCTSISGYSVGRSTTSGGPYTYSSVGNVTSNTVTGLTNNTTYYFVIRTLDGNGSVIETSSQVSATPQASSTSGGGGGGGGGNFFPPPSPNNSSVTFSGKAYPNSPILILKDGQLGATAAADANADFTATLNNLSSGNYVFVIYAFDSDGRRSKNLTFQVTLLPNASTDVSGIFIPPTIAINNFQVVAGDPLNIFGYSAPNADIDILILEGLNHTNLQSRASNNGRYSFDFDTRGKNLGDYSAQSKARIGTFSSIFNDPVAFKIGTTTIPVPPAPPGPTPTPGPTPIPPGKCPLIADLNNDCRVDLVDFSILIYWFDKSGWPAKIDINQDGVVDIIDFSIMAYYWTG